MTEIFLESTSISAWGTPLTCYILETPSGNSWFPLLKGNFTLSKISEHLVSPLFITLNDSKFSIIAPMYQVQWGQRTGGVYFTFIT